jgi:hypothetical protein
VHSWRSRPLQVYGSRSPRIYGEVLGLTARQYDSVPATSVWLMPVFVLKVPVKV